MTPKTLPTHGPPAAAQHGPSSPMVLAPEYVASVVRHVELLLARHDPKGTGSGKRAQSALARHLHVSQGTISKWLRPRRITLAQVLIIARELGLSLDQVVGYTPPAAPRLGVADQASLEDALDKIGALVRARAGVPRQLPPPSHEKK